MFLTAVQYGQQCIANFKLQVPPKPVRTLPTITRDLNWVQQNWPSHVPLTSGVSSMLLAAARRAHPPQTFHRRGLLLPHQLTREQSRVFNRILHRGEKRLFRILRLANTHHKDRQNRPISGRLIDTAVTAHANKYRPKYYLKWEPGHESWSYCGQKVHPKPGVHYQEFCLYSSYKKYMNTHSKTYFDPFERGREVLYKSEQDGRLCVVSLSKIPFFDWVDWFCVLDFISEHYDHIQRTHRTKHH